MEKKGISPLIATVLILGFTVALAAVIMTWGTSFTKDMQKKTSENTDIQMKCATDVVFNIKAVKNTTAGYDITIANDGNEDIAEWRFRLYESDTIITQKEVKGDTAEVPSFGLKTMSIPMAAVYPPAPDTPILHAEIKKVEAIPVIKGTDGKPIVCPSTIDSYGDTGGDYIS
ncbi:hypothetical protein FJZ53_02065 [Candidatus Woesearchaeota archaeon]|nr:hypothetical protein [Candidatus Woesearchaeota archaeon]